ncbi:MAG: amidase [Reyranella sp.]|uniref:amidase n=1 Tax=Reyranella sp. TaxID=1929291 RepID=UPI00120E10E8|nr:amidase [Reyranella sp.]TAJ98109.1 MAG: amidase [Reyranella sp.]
MSGADFPDTAGAFCPHGRFAMPGAAEGPLAGLTFGVKDFIDVEGHVTGAGNPRWLETHAPAAATAPCVTALLAAGATMIGKTISDELAYSLNGDNFHYGTPLNAAAPARVPGGSSSGSASAVAAGLCDFTLGTDSGGSVRIPASYCGVYGIRTTHGILSLQGIVPFMPSLDTLGWFARDAALFAAIGRILLPPTPAGRPKLKRLLRGLDAEGETDVAALAALAPAFDAVSGHFGESKTVRIAPDGLEAWRTSFRLMSAAETWSVHGAWIEREKPVFGPAIAERFAFAREASTQDMSALHAARAAIGRRLRELVGEDGLIVLPTAPGPAPFKNATGEAVEAFRQRAQRLTCIAGLSGLPQITIPASTLDGAPIGLSLIAPPGRDLDLLALAVTLEPAVRSHAATQVHRKVNPSP